jgi:hypothetical protein
MDVALPSNSANEPAIHRLVDDILAYIFLLNATPDPKSKDQPTVEHATTMASSQVCTRWRSIALNSRTIWSLIIDYPRHSLKWIEILLDRSNPSSLDFGTRINHIKLEDGRRGEGVLELVFNHIDRLRTFNLVVYTSVSASFWKLVSSQFLQMPAPNLEFVHVFFDSGVTADLHLTHPLFDNHAPNLRSFGLGGCTVDFTSPIFKLTPLTELHVNIRREKARHTLLDWLNILGGMPSLRSVHLNLTRAISSSSLNDIFPVIHLDALDMLTVNGSLHECVTLVKHLIVPPRCGLKLVCGHVHLGFDQQQLWAIIKKKIDSWATNAPYRRLRAWAHNVYVDIKNLPYEDDGWKSKEVDPTISIKLYLLYSRETASLFHSLFALFERTFLYTTSLQLWISLYRAEDFLPLVDTFRGFVNLEKLVVGKDSVPIILFPLLQHANSVLLPAMKSMVFHDVTFQEGSDSILRVADFLQWRREKGFPVQKINIINGPCRRINRKYILSHIQDTLVEMDEY